MGWSTEEMNDNESSYVVEDTEEMAEWRSINQEEMDRCWKEFAEKLEEDVVGQKIQGREQRKRSSRGRGSPLEWRRV